MRATDRYLVYDADCGFCTRTVEWVSRTGRVDARPWQGLEPASIGVTVDDVTTAAQWVVDGRSVANGAVAIGEALVARGGWTVPIGRAIRGPLLRPVASRIYSLVAEHRHAMPGGTAACRVPR